jgi:hypothetical protein
MKNLSELSTKQLLSVIEENQTLQDKLYQLIEDSAMYWVNEKLSCIRDSLKDWSIGFYQYNFIDIADYEMFVNSLVEYEDIFGLSDKCGKLLSQCLKLQGSNLFEYFAEKLKELILDEEFNTETDMDYNNKEMLEHYAETYSDQFDDYFIEDDGNIVLQTIVGHVA